MPAKNSRKMYVKDSFYHVYNRGVEGRIIFQDQQDYQVFLRFLKEYLLPPDHPELKRFHELSPLRKPINCFEDIELHCYCLMPNHFHLQLKQKSDYGLKIFMKALLTNYSMYFNHKYQRYGHLFQGVYKAIIILENAYLLHLSRYIHQNPLELQSIEDLKLYEFSSYRDFLGLRKTEWIDTNTILSTLTVNGDQNKQQEKYRNFVEDYLVSSEEASLYRKLIGID